MSIPLSVQPPAMVHSVQVDDIRRATRYARGRSEPQNQPDALGVACCDVLEEVRLRMARQGFRWD